MKRERLAAVAADIPSLRGLFVTAMPDCLLYDSWTLPSEHWHAEDAATYFGDLIRSNRSALRSLGAWSSDMQITIESTSLLIVLRELDERFVVGILFGRETALGMVRLNVRKILDRLRAIELESESRLPLGRGAKAIDFLRRYAPDPHAVLLRLALKTGIPHEDLLRSAQLSESDDQAIEEAVRDILGLERLDI